MGMSEKEVFQGQNCEEIKEKDQAKEKDEVIELDSNNSRPSSRIDDQPKQDENTEPGCSNLFTLFWHSTCLSSKDFELSKIFKAVEYIDSAWNLMNWKKSD